MRIKLTWKDPEWDSNLILNCSASEQDKAYEVAYKLGLSEYIIVELDTEAETCTILAKKRI